MNEDVFMLFDRFPDALPLYQMLEEAILELSPNVSMKVGKTQVSFSNRYAFAAAWPPARKFKGRPDIYVGLSFGLGHKVEHPRVVQAVEPYPGRWTHHVVISRPEELDGQILDWLRQAWSFSMTK